MDNTKRESLAKIITQMQELMTKIDEIKEEEEEYINNMFDLQGSERYEEAKDAYYNLEEAIDNIEKARSLIEGAIIE